MPENPPLRPFNPAAPPQRLSVSPAEAAELLGCSVQLVWKLIRKGELEGYTVGRLKRIWKESLTTYQLNHPLPKAPEPAGELPARPAKRPAGRAKRPRVSPRPGPFRHVGP